MHPFRFLHAADLHLDSPFKGLAELPHAVRARIRESTFAALRRLVELAVAERVAFVVISGDVYDTADRSLRAQLRFQQAAAELAEHGIALLVAHGNHDPSSGAKASLAWPETVHFFRSDMVETVACRDSDGRVVAEVSGISYAKAAVTDDLSALFPQPDGAVYAIGVLHTNVDGNGEHGNYAPSARARLVRSGHSYWALGHIHTRSVLHEEPFVVYPGNTQGRSVKETGDKGCYIVDVGADGSAELSFRSTAAVVWERRYVRIDGLRSEQELQERLEAEMAALLEQSSGRPVVVRLTLTGRGPLHAALRRGGHEGGYAQELVAALREQQAAAAEREGEPFVWIESCRIQTGADLPMEQLLEQDSFVGDLLRLSERLMTEQAELLDFARGALAPMVGHLRAGKLLPLDDAETLRGWLAAARELALDELMSGDMSADERLYSLSPDEASERDGTAGASGRDGTGAAAAAALDEQSGGGRAG